MFDHVDWGIVRDVVAGGYGVTFLVLIALALSAWIVGLVMQKVKHADESEDDSR